CSEKRCCCLSATTPYDRTGHSLRRLCSSGCRHLIRVKTLLVHTESVVWISAAPVCRHRHGGLAERDGADSRAQRGSCHCAVTQRSAEGELPGGPPAHSADQRSVRGPDR